MAGMLQQTQEPPRPPEQEPSAGGGRQAHPDKVQAMLIMQPVRMLYAQESAEKLIQAAQNADPAKVLAAAALAAVTGSAQAAKASGAPVEAEQLGVAVVEVIKAAAAILVSAKIVPPEEIANVVQGAVEHAAQGGEGEQGGPEAQAPGAAPGPPGGSPPGGMAGAPQPGMSAGGPPPMGV